MSPAENISKAECDRRHEETMAMLTRIHDRLFVDNGAPCVQTRLDRHDRIISLLTWAGGILGTLSMTTLFGIAVGIISGYLKFK